jgi:hypothetical protein
MAVLPAKLAAGPGDKWRLARMQAYFDLRKLGTLLEAERRKLRGNGRVYRQSE